MGLPAQYDREGSAQGSFLQDFLHPPEPIDEGCPGGWYRCGFVSSLHQYRRTRADGGLRVDNPLIHKDTDPFVLECLRYLEQEEDAAQHRFDEVRYRD